MSFKFKEGETVLAYSQKSPGIFFAKIEKTQKKGSTNQYFLHYSGWTSKYNEWMNEDKVLVVNDFNKGLAKHTNEAVRERLNAMKETASAPAGKKRKPADGGDESDSEEGGRGGKASRSGAAASTSAATGGAGAAASASSAAPSSTTSAGRSQEGIVPKPAPGAALTTSTAASTAVVASSSSSSESSAAVQEQGQGCTETMRTITMPSYNMRSVAGVLQDFLAHTQAQAAAKQGGGSSAKAASGSSSSSSSDTPTADGATGATTSSSSGAGATSTGGAKKRARKEEEGAGTAPHAAGKGQKKAEGGGSSSAPAAMPAHLQSVCKDVVDALRVYFEKIAHVLLLFKFERCYFEIWNKEKRPFLKDEAGQAMHMPSLAECFPAIFLLRLLVRFPGLVGTFGQGTGGGTGLTREEADAVSGVLQELVKFLSKNSKNKSYFGTEAYIKANTAYNAEMDKLIMQGVEGLSTAGAAGAGGGQPGGGGGPNILTKPTFLKALKMGYANCVTDAVPL